MALVSEIQLAVDATSKASCGVPSVEQFEAWCAEVGRHQNVDGCLAIRVVNVAEMAALNAKYRGKPGATNVLSFPADLPEFVPDPQLGDIVICADVVRRETEEQSKTLEAHWCHMVVHGVLHLLGYDHETERDAEDMEARERELLGAFGFSDPYDERRDQDVA